MKKLVVVIAVLFVAVLSGCSEKKDTLVVLTSSGYEPYEMVDTNGELTGLSYS